MQRRKVYLDACSGLGVSGYLRAIARHVYLVQSRGMHVVCVHLLVSFLLSLLPLINTRSANFWNKLKTNCLGIHEISCSPKFRNPA